MNLKYRPEIDGLRAIAIMSVILFHAQISKIIKGGYIGVDIFFVISGYLITSIILKEIESTNNFSFLHFIIWTLVRSLTYYNLPFDTIELLFHFIPWRFE